MWTRADLLCVSVCVCVFLTHPQREEYCLCRYYESAEREREKEIVNLAYSTGFDLPGVVL